jgi:molybdopterin-guanine dinucleotide biosynthesis protein A
MSDHDRTLGLILAGGKARRLGGEDKALLALGGEPMLARVIERLAPQCGTLVLNANGDAARFASFALPVVADERQDFSGPLAGLLAGLEFCVRALPEATHVVSLPADTPFAPQDLVARLHEARRSFGAEIAVARSGDHEHHLAALWPVTIAGALRDALHKAVARKVGSFAARFKLVHADWPVAPFDPFFNVNTPEDLARAEAILRSGSGADMMRRP